MGRSLPLLLAMAAAAAPAGARAEDPPAGPDAAAPADDAAARAAEAALEAELEAGAESPSIALGPARSGKLTIAAEVGWLRSGLRFDLGIAHRIDLVARVDTMLLYDVLSGQTSVSGGARVTPFVWQRARLTGEVTIGQLFSPTEAQNGTVTVLRAEAIAGFLAGPALAYVRGALRGLRMTPATGSSYTNDQELGFGIEGHHRRFVAGAEWYVIARPHLESLSQWRVRLGVAL